MIVYTYLQIHLGGWLNHTTCPCGGHRGVFLTVLVEGSLGSDGGDGGGGAFWWT